MNVHELYTALDTVKECLATGNDVPMTDVGEHAREIIDPELTIGDGALDEDPVLGLRCPVRGCGRYTHTLGLHCTLYHRNVGGARAVKMALSLPINYGLLSKSARAAASDRARQRRSAGASGKQMACVRRKRRRSPLVGDMRRLKGMERNKRKRCVRQTTHALIDLSHEIGRTPSSTEAAAKFGKGFVKSAERAFGSWNATLLACGLPLHTKGPKPGKEAQRLERVLAGLSAWHATHGRLPFAREASTPLRAPAIPYRDTILAAFRTDSWAYAMQQAAALLDIHGGRYGLPERKSDEAA